VTNCICELNSPLNIGLGFVHGELIGWLWFAIGRSHVTDRLSRPHSSKHIIRKEKRYRCKEKGKIIVLKIMRAHEFKIGNLL